MLEKFSKQQMPESDLSVRARHKIDKFRKEDANKTGMIKFFLIADTYTSRLYDRCGGPVVRASIL